MRLNEFLRVMTWLTITLSFLEAGSSPRVETTCRILELNETMPKQLPCSVKIYADASEVEVSIKLLDDGRKFIYSDGYNQAELLNDYAAEMKEGMFDMLCIKQLHRVEVQEICYERNEDME